MEIRLLAFASASDAVGATERRLELPDEASVADLERLLVERFPELEAIWPRLALALDGEIVAPESRLTEGCELALLPPVSGG